MRRILILLIFLILFSSCSKNKDIVEIIPSNEEQINDALIKKKKIFLSSFNNHEEGKQIFSLSQLASNLLLLVPKFLILLFYLQKFL